MRKIIIEKINSGQRIDKFLAKEFFSYSRGEMIRQIKNGNILINGEKTKPSHVLKENDKVEINLEENNGELIPNEKIKLEIIFQDENIIVVNKPAGLQVHPGHHEKNNTLANALIAKFPELKNVGEDPMRPGIVHRLDKDTSGIMIVARNQEAFHELKRKFQKREVEKKYLAIVCGHIQGSGIIDKPLARAATYKKQVIAGKKTRTKVRTAVTEYEAIKAWSNFSLVEVSPKTGRTHQIRVHLTSIGHPIAGDKVYKLKNMEASDAPRQMLHAKSIRFELFGQNYSFEALEPRDFRLFLTKAG